MRDAWAFSFEEYRRGKYGLNAIDASQMNAALTVVEKSFLSIDFDATVISTPVRYH